jgi:hypothetical protein
MKDRDKYWLAGLLEGEGSFMAGPPSQPNQPRIACQMADRDVIERLAELFGVSYIHESTPNNENWATTYRTEVRGANAMELMRLLRPLMGERRQQQIDDALESYDEFYRTESHSDYKREKVERAWNLIQDGERLIDVSKRLNLKYQFVRDLNTGRTWTGVTGL